MLVIHLHHQLLHLPLQPSVVELQVGPIPGSRENRIKHHLLFLAPQEAQTGRREMGLPRHRCLVRVKEKLYGKKELLGSQEGPQEGQDSPKVGEAELRRVLSSSTAELNF